MAIHNLRMSAAMAIAVGMITGCSVGGSVLGAGADKSGATAPDADVGGDQTGDDPAAGDPGGGDPGGGDPGGGDPGGGDPLDAGTDPTGGDPPPVGSCPNDPFGVKEIYCTTTGGDEWFFDMANPTVNTLRFNPQTTLTKNPDGSWKVTNTQVRMRVIRSGGYKPSLITTYDQDELAKKGYMQQAGDWRNVEMTGYVKVNNAGEGDDNFGWFARGGLHGSSAGDGGTGCEGTAYKANVHFSGATQLAKKQWHSGGYAFGTKKPAQEGSLVGKWVGLKAIIYDTPQGVKVELYADWAANNTWTKVDELHDTGGLGTEGDHCGGPPDGKVAWGGPIAYFSWDTATDVDFKNFSVREIAPPSATPPPAGQ